MGLKVLRHERHSRTFACSPRPSGKTPETIERRPDETGEAGNPMTASQEISA
jgi:hypothetical protein